MTPAERAATLDEMREILIGVAKLRTTITYGELASLITTVGLHVRAPQYYDLLRDLCREEDAQERGFLGALVVRKSDGRPGQGFYKIMAKHGRDCSDPEACWQREVDLVYQVWGED